ARPPLRDGRPMRAQRGAVVRMDARQQFVQRGQRRGIQAQRRLRVAVPGQPAGGRVVWVHDGGGRIGGGAAGAPAVGADPQEGQQQRRGRQIALRQQDRKSVV